MSNIKMRCHFSIIFERIWKVLVLLLIIIFNQMPSIINNIDEIKDIDKIAELGTSKIIMAAGAFVLLFVIIIIYNILVWYRTYIWIEDNTIIVERNTINKKKNTYSIYNISNINIEQNLFERIVGTNTIKIDTNSSAKLSGTDIKIVFKNDKAQEFKNLIMSQMKNTDGETASGEQEEYDVVCSHKDVIMHCIYNIKILSVVILLGTIIGFIIVLLHVNVGDSTLEIIKNAIGGTIAFIILIVSTVQSMVKSYFSFYGFKAKRSKDMIYLEYGLLKKKTYTIPLDKINAVKIVQPLISRILKKYSVEIVNVGMGDEKNESAQLTLSCSKKEVEKYITLLLPEYIDSTRDVIYKQSPLYFIHKGPGIIIWLIFLIAASAVTGMLSRISLWMPVLASLLIFLFVITTYIMTYFTGGFHAADNYLSVSFGAYTKIVAIVPYNKIQFIEIKKSPLERFTKLSKATIHILAMKVISVINLPYAAQDSFKIISNKIVEER